MKLTLIFPNVNRSKSYTSNHRRYTVWINSKQTFVIDQDSPRDGEVEVKEGDKIFIDKRFAYRNKDASFYYIVGDSTAELINQEGKKKNVYVNISQGVLHILDDLDFKKAIHVAK
tara:strand:+ start:388 stop:732 length:345 start_codon:yes stop_codon:yes gene_type:complete